VLCETVSEKSELVFDFRSQCMIDRQTDRQTDRLKLTIALLQDTQCNR